MNAGGAARVLRAELLKLWTLPAIRWALVGTPLASGLLAAAVMASSIPSRSSRVTPVQTWTAVDGAAPYVQAGVVLLGALVAGHEYAGRQVRTTLVAVPQRTRLGVAKVVAAVLVLLPASLASVMTGHLGAVLVALERGQSWTPGDARHSIGLVAWLLVVGLIAHGVATLTRSATTALVMVLALVLVVSPLLHVAGRAAGWLPDRAAHQWVLLDPSGLSAAPATAVAVAWVFLAGLAGTMRLVRSDA